MKQLKDEATSFDMVEAYDRDEEKNEDLVFRFRHFKRFYKKWENSDSE